MTTCELTIKLPSMAHLKLVSDFLASFRHTGFEELQKALALNGLTPVTVGRPDQLTIVMEPDMQSYDDEGEEYDSYL